MDALKLVDDTNWSLLLHAYGAAEDTPEHLRAIIDPAGEPDRLDYDHMWGSVLHQGSVHTSTPACVRALRLALDAGSLPEDRVPFALNFISDVARSCHYFEIAPQLDDLREHAKFDLPAFIEANGADAVWGDEKAETAQYSRAYVELFDELPESAEVATKFIHGGGRAAMSAAALLQRVADGLAVEPDLRSRWAADVLVAARAAESDVRAALALSAALLGADVSEFLEDPSPWVRLCSAIEFESDASTEILRSVLGDPAGIDELYEVPPPQFSMKVRFFVLTKLLQRTETFDEVFDVAMAIVPITSPYVVDVEWGPLVARAFAESPGRITTDRQHEFLQAVIDAGLVDSGFGNPWKWFKDVDLPYDKAKLQAMLDSAG